MKSYLTFEQILSRVTYGTKIRVVEYPNPDKAIFEVTWSFDNKTENLESWIRKSEITAFSIKDGALVIEIVAQETHS